MKTAKNATKALKGIIKNRYKGLSSSAWILLNVASPFDAMIVVVILSEWGIVCKPLYENNVKPCFKKYDIFKLTLFCNSELQGKSLPK